MENVPIVSYEIVYNIDIFRFTLPVTHKKNNNRY